VDQRVWGFVWVVLVLFGGVVTCVFLGFVGDNGCCCMLSHAHGGGFNMAICWVVKKNAAPTSKQAQKTAATQKSNCPQLQSCGNFKPATPTQNKKLLHN
jgi:hypothetical protein